MKKILALLLFSSSTFIYGQQAKSDDKLDLVKTMMFESLKMSFPQNAVPASNKLKTDYTFPWLEVAKYEKSAISSELKNFVNSYEIKKEEEELVLFSSFAENFDVIEKHLSIEIVNQQIKNEKGLAVVLEPKSKYINLSSTSSSIEETDSTGEVIGVKNSSFYTVEKIFETTNAFKQITGTITIETKHLLSYSFKKITKSDIGKEIVYGSNKIKVLSFEKNVFTYQLIEGDGEFSHFATNSNDVPYKDNTSRSKVSQQDVDFVNSHPNFTQEDVNLYVESIRELLAQKKIVKNIFVVRYDGNVSNVYFYKPDTYITESTVLKIAL